MTETEWLADDRLENLLECLKAMGYDRKLRLFACTCCRRIWPRLTDERSRSVVEAAERFADQLITEEEMAAAKDAAAAARDAAWDPAWDRTVAWDPARFYVNAAARAAKEAAAATAAKDAAAAAWDAAAAAREPAETRVLTTLLREIAGNPFRTLSPLNVGSLALNGDVKRLAEAAYDDRLLPTGELDPVRLAVLCDCLLDACYSADHEILLHLRGPGPHVRGCWVVDLLTGRK